MSKYVHRCPIGKPGPVSLAASMHIRICGFRTPEHMPRSVRIGGDGDWHGRETADALVRQELKLVQVEMTEKGKKAGVGVGMFGGAGVVGLLALGAFTACLIAALATGMEVWIAALIVTVLYGAAAGVLALQGKSRVREATPPVPKTATTRRLDPGVRRDDSWRCVG